jgi:RNA polymerase sigma factor (sigma-70 family)
VQEHREAMVHFAAAHTPYADRADGEGIVQDALVLLLTKNVTWPDSDRECLAIVRGYIRNVARNRAQKASARRHVPIQNHPLALPSDPWREAWKRRARNAIAAALDELTPAQREVTVMRLMLGMSFWEIADTRGSSENTAKVLYQRARARLRRALELLGPRP